MLARIKILLPFTFLVPEKETFKIYEYEEEGYRVRFFPPRRSERADRYNDAESINLNGVAAFNADVLHIDFRKEELNREESFETDPPLKLIETVANNFLLRARYVTNGKQIRPIRITETNWDIRYLNDDESELPKVEGVLRERGMRKFKFSYTALNNEVWDNIHSIYPKEQLPNWRFLLLDADLVLPEVGPAIVLMFTALEVFISSTLDQVARDNDISDEMWEWINMREYLKVPSIEEKYDFLSRHLIGKSIKEDSDLWDAFKHLRKARNSFAHDGIAEIGNDEVTVERAKELLLKANEIISFIKNSLPENLHWLEFKHDIKVEFIHTIKKGYPSSSDESDLSDEDKSEEKH